MNKILKHFNMLVSVIMPSFNSSRYFKSTLLSVLNQTYENWELIIIDDASTDNSIELIEEYVNKDSRIRLLKLEVNSGAAIARNKGIEMARGEYIAFLDSDDFWLPDKLERQLSIMKSNNYLFTHTSYSLCNENVEPLNKKTIAPVAIEYKDLIKYNWIGTSTVIFNSKVLGKSYMPNIRNRQDWAMWLTLIKKSSKAYFIDEPLVRYRIREGSISKKKTRLIKFHWRIYREVEKFNFLKASYFLCLNLVNHMKKGKIIDEI